MSTSKLQLWRDLTFALLAAYAVGVGAAALGKIIPSAATASALDASSSEAARRRSLTTLAADPALRTKMRAEFATLRRKAQREFSARMPRPFLPEAQRGAWIAAWQRMRACAQRHDFHGVSEVAPSYGDGETAMPNVDLDQPNAQAALTACPFEGPTPRAAAQPDAGQTP